MTLSPSVPPVPVPPPQLEPAGRGVRKALQSLKQPKKNLSFREENTNSEKQNVNFGFDGK